MVNKTYLYVHFDDGFTNKRGTKKRPEWNKEVTTGDASEVKQRVRYLKMEQDQNYMCCEVKPMSVGNRVLITRIDHYFTCEKAIILHIELLVFIYNKVLMILISAHLSSIST